MIRRILATVAIAAIACGVGACDLSGGIGLGNIDWSCDSSCMRLPPGKPYAISPESVRVLRGDTVRFISCADLFYCGLYASSAGNTLTQWSVPNDSILTILTAEGTDTSVASSNSILVRAIATGRARVAAMSLKLGTRETASVTVADSSEITTIDVEGVVQGRLNVLRRGETTHFSVYLRDQAGRIYRAVPTGYSVSDSSTLTVRTCSMVGTGACVAVFTPKPGQADLRIHFLGLTKVIPVAVTP